MGFKIRKCREEAGMTQEQLSKRSGVSRATISGLESGRIKVTSTGTLLKIADAIGKEVGDLFCTETA